MKELSLNILDITENSIKAGAKNIAITLSQVDNLLTFSVADDGCGMTEDFAKSVIDPFCTTRTTRKVGMGIPLLKLAAEQTGGKLSLCSRHFEQYPQNHGTEITATFYTDHIDCAPLGDIVATIKTLIQCNPDIDFMFRHTANSKEVQLDTAELRTVLGDVPLDTYEVIKWIENSLNEQYALL